jgi:hypothetical protein
LGSSFHRFSKWRWFSKWNDWKFGFTTIIHRVWNIFAFCFLIWGHISQKKSFLSNSRWRLMSNMPAEIQNSITQAFCNIFAFYSFVFLSATWIKSVYCQMSQKWRFDPKWRIKIRFFDLTLRVSNIFAIFVLHSFGVRKTQILWKKSFSKNPRWRLKRFFSLDSPSWIFWKLFLHKICVFLNAKRRLKEYWIHSELCKKIWFWSAILDRTAIFDSFDNIRSWFMLLTKIQTHCKEYNTNILENAWVMLLWISAGILDIRRHLESDKKLFFGEICSTKIHTQIKK